MRRFTVVGAFEFGEFENDSTLALVHIEDAARLLRMPPGTIGGVRLHLEGHGPGLARGQGNF